MAHPPTRDHFKGDEAVLLTARCEACAESSRINAAAAGSGKFRHMLRQLLR